MAIISIKNENVNKKKVYFQMKTLDGSHYACFYSYNMIFTIYSYNEIILVFTFDIYKEIY